MKYQWRRVDGYYVYVLVNNNGQAVDTNGNIIDVANLTLENAVLLEDQNTGEVIKSKDPNESAVWKSQAKQAGEQLALAQDPLMGASSATIESWVEQIVKGEEPVFNNSPVTEDMIRQHLYLQAQQENPDLSEAILKQNVETDLNNLKPVAKTADLKPEETALGGGLVNTINATNQVIDNAMANVDLGDAQGLTDTQLAAQVKSGLIDPTTAYLALITQHDRTPQGAVNWLIEKGAIPEGSRPPEGATGGGLSGTMKLGYDFNTELPEDLQKDADWYYNLTEADMAAMDGTGELEYFLEDFNKRLTEWQDSQPESTDDGLGWFNGTGGTGTTPEKTPEQVLAEYKAGLEGQGYRVFTNPDGTLQWIDDKGRTVYVGVGRDGTIQEAPRLEGVLPPGTYGPGAPTQVVGGQVYNAQQARDSGQLNEIGTLFGQESQDYANTAFGGMSTVVGNKFVDIQGNEVNPRDTNAIADELITMGFGPGEMGRTIAEELFRKANPQYGADYQPNIAELGAFLQNDYGDTIPEGTSLGVPILDTASNRGYDNANLIANSFKNDVVVPGAENEIQKLLKWESMIPGIIEKVMGITPEELSQLASGVQGQQFATGGSTPGLNQFGQYVETPSPAEMTYNEAGEVVGIPGYSAVGGDGQELQGQELIDKYYASADAGGGEGTQARIAEQARNYSIQQGPNGLIVKNVGGQQYGPFNSYQEAEGFVRRLIMQGMSSSPFDTGNQPFGNTKRNFWDGRIGGGMTSRVVNPSTGNNRNDEEDEEERARVFHVEPAATIKPPVNTPPPEQVDPRNPKHRDGGVLYFANGGTMRVDKPTALVDMATNETLGIAGEAGSEDINITPRQQAMQGVQGQMSQPVGGMPKFSPETNRKVLLQRGVKDKIAGEPGIAGVLANAVRVKEQVLIANGTSPLVAQELTRNALKTEAGRMRLIQESKEQVS